MYTTNPTTGEMVVLAVLAGGGWILVRLWQHGRRHEKLDTEGAKNEANDALK